MQEYNFYLIKYTSYLVNVAQLCFYLEAVKYVWSGLVS